MGTQFEDKNLWIFLFGCVVVHSIISVLIFKSEYYAKFFTGNGKLTFSAELSMLFGVFAFLVFTMMAIVTVPGVADSIGKKTWRGILKYSPIGLFLTLLHLVMMGHKSWLEPESWPANFLPISLLASVMAGSAIILKIYFYIIDYD